MKETRVIMGMPITVVLPMCPTCGLEDDVEAVFAGGPDDFRIPQGAKECDHMHNAANDAFAYLESVDRRFSTYKSDSEVSAFRRGEVTAETASKELRRVIRLCDETKALTEGYFDAWADGNFDPSGVVKGWALHNAGRLLERAGFTSYAVDGGGDIEVKGTLPGDRKWRIGIRNPFEPRTIIKALEVTDCGIATSGSYIRGPHIFNPFTNEPVNEIASVTVVGPNVFQADRLATAAFVMGAAAVEFLVSLPGIEAYVVDNRTHAVYTQGFERYLAS